MQKYTVSVTTKKFSGKSMKDAYMKCCKWIATNIIADSKLSEICEYSIQKQTENAMPYIVLDIKVSINKEDADNKHCAICRETHNSFLFNDKTNCDDCKLRAYHRREEGLIQVKADYVKELLKAKEEK